MSNTVVRRSFVWFLIVKRRLVLDAFFLLSTMRRKSQRRVLSPASARLTPAETATLDEAARLAGSTRSALLREGGLALAKAVADQLKTATAA